MFRSATIIRELVLGPISYICPFALASSLGNKADLCLGPRLIILGAVPPFAIRLHIVLLKDSFATLFCLCP